MLRDKNLIPLSHQHQHALACYVRLDRALQAGEVDLEAWQAEIQQLFEQEISIHFAAEEKVLFPAAAKFQELRSLIEELRSEHAALREMFKSAARRDLDRTGLGNFGALLSTHIRKEERQLFEGMQKLLSADDLIRIGAELQNELEQAPAACIFPTGATRLRPRQN
jgi:hemerythrin-like domain-containing protein